MAPALPVESFVFQETTKILNAIKGGVPVFPCLPDPGTSTPFVVYTRVRTSVTDGPLDPQQPSDESATMLVAVYCDEMSGQFDKICGLLKSSVKNGGLHGAVGPGVQGCFFTDFRTATYALKQPKGSKNVILGQLYFTLQLAEPL